MEKLVSAIITTHNRKELLKRAIDSVFEQTYPNLELIVVDDASDDGTKDICVDKRINYIFIPKEESRGGNYARNLGIKASQGNYCAFLDDDDYWLPSKIEKQVSLMEKMDCELVHCGRRFEIVFNDEVEYKNTLPDPNHWGDMHKKILFTSQTAPTSCFFIKRQALLDIGMFDEDLKFWQDYELTIRLAQRKPFYFVNEPLTVMRVNRFDSQRLSNKYFEWKKSAAYIYNKHSNLYNKLNLFEKYKVKNVYWKSAKIRSKKCGLLSHFLFYSFMYLPYSIIGKINKSLHKQ